MFGFTRYSVRYFCNKFKSPYVLKPVTKHIKLDQITCFHRSSLLNVIGQEIKMPSLSPTMTEGKIVKWLKKEGDQIKPGDLLCEIQTDKAIMAFETEEEGVLAKILVREDSDVKVGKLIALMVNEGEHWEDVEIPTGGVAAPSGTKTKESSEQSMMDSGDKFTGTKITMPSLSPTMMEGTIIKWLVKEGEKVAPGDALCEIQTDKAVMVFETEEEGILAKILVSDNTPEVKVGSLIALIVDEGVDWQNVSIPKESEPSTVSKSVTEEFITHKSEKEEKLKLWPAVRFLIDQYRLDPHVLQASGPKGRLIKKDVLKYISENHLTPHHYTPEDDSTQEIITESESTQESDVGFVDVEISNMRRTIAKRLTFSKTEIPHAYSIIEAEVDELIKSRKELKVAGINVSLNDFVVKAVAAALQDCPFANCLYLNDQIEISPTVDISIAVATPNGLITPIIKSADSKSVVQVSEETKDLAERARENKLQLHEFQGGSFTISNLGMFGIREFSAIINPPQCGILAVGSGRKLLVGNRKTVTKMACTLSYDERAMDQLGAAEFLSTLQYYLESPALLLASHNKKIPNPSIEERHASSSL